MAFRPSIDSIARYVFLDGDRGGLGVQFDTRPIRCVGSIEELRALKHGFLSMRQVSQLRDNLEGRVTEADRAAALAWFGQNHRRRMDDFQNVYRAIRRTSYVSCWHQADEHSDVSRLVGSYTNSEFKCVLKGNITELHRAMPPQPDAKTFIDLVAVRYIQDETQLKEDYLEAASLTTIAPHQLAIKRREQYGWEKEVRFVHFNTCVMNLNPGAAFYLAQPYPDLIYAPICPQYLVAGVYALNQNTYDQIERLDLEIPLCRVDEANLLHLILHQ